MYVVILNNYRTVTDYQHIPLFPDQLNGPHALNMDQMDGNTIRLVIFCARKDENEKTNLLQDTLLGVYNKTN